MQSPVWSYGQPLGTSLCVSFGGHKLSLFGYIPRKRIVGSSDVRKFS